MKMPEAPPPFPELMRKHFVKKDFLTRAFASGAWSATIGDDQYVHWDKLRYHTPPAGVTLEEWWAAIKGARVPTSKRLPCSNNDHEPFQITTPDPLQRYLTDADRDLNGRLPMPDAVVNPDTRDRFRVSASIEEAITSSQLEGATTTRKVAAAMLRSGRQPTDKSERMIFNNYKAMDFIRKIQGRELTPDLVRELHGIVTDRTLDDPSDAGRFRTAKDESVAVYGSGLEADVVYHKPPAWAELPQRVQSLCDFANEKQPTAYVHPIVRAILLHFFLGYIHPFVDGNGRTARALFYWSMARDKYWLCEYLSISHVIKQAPAEYALAFLYTETDDNDTTYFVLSQLKVLRKATEALHDYVRLKMSAMSRAQKILRQSHAYNHRQLALLGHALQHSESVYSATSHANSHDVSTVTARADLNHLAKTGLLLPLRAGQGFIYTVPPDLEERLEKLGRKASGPI
jgi:Fic family protein